MIDILSVPDEQLNQTLRLIKHEIKERHWKAQLAYIGSSHCFIDRGHGENIHIFSATPPTSTYPAAKLANDKFATYQVLLSAHLPQMETILIDGPNQHQEAILFMNKFQKIVAKPVDGGHGKGITVGITTEEDLVQAIKTVHEIRKDESGVLLQQQYAHEVMKDVRILCIDYRFIAATLRIPARVYGDGSSTIGTLIDSENTTNKRGRAYYAPLATIDVSKAEIYLKDSIHTVPSAGQEVTVLGIANYGAGGETVDITDDIPTWLRELAEKAAYVSKLPVNGIDFMLATEPNRDATYEQLDPVITEINKCPMLAMHDQPTIGQSRSAVKIYVDYLDTLN